MKTEDLQDDIHANFGQLLRELNKQDAPYALSVANRLYGEQSYQFHEVRVLLALVDESASNLNPGLIVLFFTPQLSWSGTIFC